MMKWIDPLITRFKLAPRPRLFAVHDQRPVIPDAPTTGQRLAAQGAELAEQNERLSQQNAELVAGKVAMERKLDEHVVSNPRAHATQLMELGTRLRAVHATVCADPGVAPAGVAGSINVGRIPAAGLPASTVAA